VKACFKDHAISAACKDHAKTVKEAICSCAAEGLDDPAVTQAIHDCHGSSADEHEEDQKHEDDAQHKKASRHLVKMFCHREHHGKGGRHHGGGDGRRGG